MSQRLRIYIDSCVFCSLPQGDWVHRQRDASNSMTPRPRITCLELIDPLHRSSVISCFCHLFMSISAPAWSMLLCRTISLRYDRSLICKSCKAVFINNTLLLLLLRLNLVHVKSFGFTESELFDARHNAAAPDGSSSCVFHIVSDRDSVKKLIDDTKASSG